MRGYGLVVAVLVSGALLLFGLAEWAAMPLLTDPLPAMRAAGAAAAFLGLGLLTADVVLPVPASVVMVAHGALFGLVPGAAVSMLGGVSATLVGFALGRRGRGIVERVTTPAARARADRLLTRWGPWAVVSTRAVPVLAETVAVLAGTSPMRWSVAICAGAAGTAVPALRVCRRRSRRQQRRKHARCGGARARVLGAAGRDRWSAASTVPAEPVPRRVRQPVGAPPPTLG